MTTPDPLSAAPPTPWRFELRDPDETAALAARVAEWLRAGDVVTLGGDLGSGKTTFARAAIRHLARRPDMEVPSPSFTLMQIYDGPRFPIVHADLYRLGGADELAELGWDDAADGAVVMVEWPDRLGRALPADRLDITFALPDGEDETQRIVELDGRGRFAARLREAWAIEQCLERAGFADATRAFLTGDASTRAYERLTHPDGRTALLMLSPPRTDAPVARYGRPYHHIARLAGDMRPFVAVDAGLRDQGLSAPAILAHDIPAGIAVLEDLGAEPCIDANGPIPERYLETVRLLATLHGRRLPATLPLDGQSTYTIPPYDLDALLVEVELMIDWYAPQIARTAISASARAAFIAIFESLFEPVLAAPATWVLRDVHSPNLIWLPERHDIARVGLIDFQDCVLGHPAYDVAALLQDARVTVPDGLELKLLSAYAQMRRSTDPGFVMADFSAAYAIMGVQRATKILGIFARLDRRDNKPQYLAHLPRMERYLVKGLAHPALAELRAWYDTFVPRAIHGAGA